jgi:hypothetical protein
MPPTVTPLTGRSQTFVFALIGLMVIMGTSPLFEMLVIRWPLRFGEAPWRFQTFQLFLENGPQLAVLISVLAIVGLLTGNRILIRSAAVAFGVIAFVTLVVLLLFVLDFLQVRRIVRQEAKATFNGGVLKNLMFGGLLVIGAGWTALKGWQSSEPPDATARRVKGEGLVVGQPKEPRPAA